MRELIFELPELPFAAEEAMNRLRINMKFISENTRRIMITSSLENEGKSTISIYLWKMLAESGEKTAYLDLDLRKSVMLKRFCDETEGELYGIEHYLSGMQDYNEVIYSTNIANGFCLPCVNPIQNPSTLFEDQRFSKLMEELKNSFRYVIIDTPPLFNVSDGMKIASMSDGVILVVRSGFTSKQAVRQSIQYMEAAQCPLLGTVLNCVDMGGRGYGNKYGKKYGYGSKYGYGYGYGYGHTSKGTIHKAKDKGHK